MVDTRKVKVYKVKNSGWLDLDTSHKDKLLVGGGKGVPME